MLIRVDHMHEQSPIMYVFAGNNGSGKSTIRNLIVDRLGIGVNIDPDAIKISLEQYNRAPSKALYFKS